MCTGVVVFCKISTKLAIIDGEVAGTVVANNTEVIRYS